MLECGVRPNRIALENAQASTLRLRHLGVRYNISLAEVSTAAPPSLDRRRIVCACLAAVAAFLAFDALIFRSGLYAGITEPNSTAGAFELTYRRELQKQSELGGNVVVTLGDSRFGYLPRQANELTAESGYVFRHAGVAGGDARTWYYMLRDLDPTARRYRAVVFGVNDFDDEDTGYQPDTDLGPMHSFIGHLRLSDVLEFARSFRGAALQWSAFRGSVLKGFVYQSDFHALLSNPLKRADDVRMGREDWPQWTYDYEEDPRSLAGLSIDWKLWRAAFPPGADDVQRETVRDILMRPVARQEGVVAEFRRRWYGKIFEHYRGSPTRIIFVRLARGPVLRPQNLVVKRSSSVREFAALPNVALAQEHFLDVLERPDYFKDGTHVNREGAAQFAPLLVREVRRILGPAQ